MDLSLERLERIADAATAFRPDLIDALTLLESGTPGATTKSATCVGNASDKLLFMMCRTAKLQLPASPKETVVMLHGEGILPKAIYNSLMSVTLCSHGNMSMPVEDVQHLIQMFLTVLEWYVCESKLGPGLDTLFPEPKPKPETKPVVAAAPVVGNAAFPFPPEIQMRRMRELVLRNSQFTNPKLWAKLDPQRLGRIYLAVIATTRQVKSDRIAEIEAELATLRQECEQIAEKLQGHPLL